MFSRNRFEEYIAAFNAAAYDDLHREFFHHDVTIQLQGYLLAASSGVRAFYDFFHRYVSERLEIVRYLPHDRGFFAELRMELTAFKTLDLAELEAVGLTRLPQLPEGAVHGTTLFLDYHIQSGKIRNIRCAELPDAAETFG